MTLVAAKQLGAIRHLPDPPLAWDGVEFHADRVTSRPEAVLFGLPDAPIEALSLAATVPLALWSGRAGDRRPWLPLFVCGKAAAEAVIAGWYVERMRTHVRAWCAYCLAGAALNAAIALAAVPDGARALRDAPPRQTAAVAGVVALGWLLWRAARGRSADGRMALGQMAHGQIARGAREAMRSGGLTHAA